MNGKKKDINTIIRDILTAKTVDTDLAVNNLIAAIHSEEGISTLVKVLKDPNDYLTSLAIQALITQDNTKVAKALMPLLESEHVGIIRASIQVLGEIGSIEAVIPLIARLKYDNYLVRIEAAAALGKIGNKRAVEPLIDMLDDKISIVRASAAQSLGELADELAVEPLIFTLLKENDSTDEDEIVRKYIIEALGNFKSLKAFNTLLTVLQHRKEFSYVIRWAAARSLGKINDQKAVEPLIAILIEESNTLRRGIIEALGQLRSEQAIDPLITFLRDEDSSIRGTVVEALGLIGSNRALPALNWVQQNDNGIYAYQRIREIAFEAIKSIELLQQGQELR